jgi:hypothetical protein
LPDRKAKALAAAGDDGGAIGERNFHGSLDFGFLRE